MNHTIINEIFTIKHMHMQNMIRNTDINRRLQNESRRIKKWHLQFKN